MKVETVINEKLRFRKKAFIFVPVFNSIIISKKNTN